MSLKCTFMEQQILSGGALQILLVNISFAVKDIDRLKEEILKAI